jgi:LysR family hydrogen peroxide-inducible transcriptional activator
MPTMQQLRYLVAIADTLNFSRAAELSHVTQPTLSMQLKEMEMRLGTQLVERTRARVLLTPAGQEIVRRARSILSELADIQEIAASHDPSALQTTLQVGVVQTVGAYILSVAMPDLRQAFPDLKIIVREGRLEDLPQRLLDGVHDVLLLPSDPCHPEITSVLLLREPLQLVLPAEHALAVKEAVEPEDLKGETILTMEKGHRIYDQISHLCREVGAIHASEYAGTTLDTLRLMVTTGMGMSLLPALYVRSDVLREKLVVARPLTRAAPVRELTMCWRASSPRAVAYQNLASIVHDCLRPWEASPQAGSQMLQRRSSV